MSAEKTDTPFDLEEQTKIRLPMLMLCSLLTIVAVGAAVWSGDHKAVGEHTEQLAAQEARIKKLEESQTEIAVMKNDVRWIRQAIEQSEKKP